MLRQEILPWLTSRLPENGSTVCAEWR
jgi:hypothetical protein